MDPGNTPRPSFGPSTCRTGMDSTALPAVTVVTVVTVVMISLTTFYFYSNLPTGRPERPFPASSCRPGAAFARRAEPTSIRRSLRPGEASRRQTLASPLERSCTASPSRQYRSSARRQAPKHAQRYVRHSAWNWHRSEHGEDDLAVVLAPCIRGPCLSCAWWKSKCGLPAQQQTPHPRQPPAVLEHDPPVVLRPPAD